MIWAALYFIILMQTAGAALILAALVQEVQREKGRRP